MKSNKKIVFLGIFVLAFLVMGVVPVCGLSDSGANSPICGLTDSGSPEVSQNFSFYAVYDRLVEGLHGGGCAGAAMSGDANKLIYAEWSATSNSTLYTLNADGTGLTQIALPDLDGRCIGELIIDHDGSRAFFKAGGVLCKVENGVATKIFDTDDYPDIGSLWSQIQTTADGRYVYFKDSVPNDCDVWRVAHSGGSPELIIDDYLVPRDCGPGWSVSEFAISDDGSTIAFTLNGYRDHDYFGIDSYRSKRELFVWDATGGYRQLTNDDDDVGKSYLAISGDGSTIVFKYGPSVKWYSIKSDGSAMIFLEDAGYNIGGPVLNYDGTKMFYSDHKGGRLVNTDGSGSIDLFPSWNVGAITIAARTDLCISDDGHRISFISYGSYVILDHDLYIGYLDDFNAVPDAPIIESIAFDPPAMPRGDPDAVIVLTSEVSDPQGLADIKRTSTNELVDGRLESYSYIPVAFHHAANDVGRAPDETAGDGIFSSAGTPAPKIDELDQMTVRMGVKDASGAVVVADTVLFIGEVPPTPAPTPTGTSTKPEILSHSSYISGLGFFKVVGEVKNNLPDNIKYVKIIATFYDAEKNVVGTDFTYTRLNILKPNQKSPFDLSTYPDKIRPASYKLKVSYKVSNEEPFAGLVILSHRDRIDSMGYHKIVGEVKNNGVSASSYVKLVSTYYDAKGEVIGTDFTYTDPSDIDAGDSAPFELSSYPRKLRPSRYELQVEGR